MKEMRLTDVRYIILSYSKIRIARRILQNGRELGSKDEQVILN